MRLARPNRRTASCSTTSGLDNAIALLPRPRNQSIVSVPRSIVAMAGIIVDFDRPMPIFPLEGFVLLPHAVQPLHIFEPRYRQMVRDCLAQVERGSGQIALASFVPPSAGGDSPAGSESGEVVGGGWRRIRPVACVGQIIQHEELDDGRFNILLQGVCRAAIVEVEEPDGDRLYHQVRLKPLAGDHQPEGSLAYVRSQLRAMLSGPQLRRMSNAGAVMEWIKRAEIPTSAVVEIASFALVFDEEVRYLLLAEPTVDGRIRLLRRELARLACLVRRADEQSWRDWPKGMSWN